MLTPTLQVLPLGSGTQHTSVILSTAFWTDLAVPTGKPVFIGVASIGQDNIVYLNTSTDESDEGFALRIDGNTKRGPYHLVMQVDEGVTLYARVSSASVTLNLVTL